MISNQKTTKKGRNVVCNNSRGRPRTREAYSVPSLLVSTITQQVHQLARAKFKSEMDDMHRWISSIP